jgi:cell division protein ZapA
MPEVSISIGGRQFEVACQEGEEHYLHAAAQMLDEEAQALINQVGRMPEGRMLLMAGLMLADKTASMEDKLRSVEGQIGQQTSELEQLRNAGAVEPERIEVPVVPQSVTDTLSDLVDRAEALAAKVETPA